MDRKKIYIGWIARTNDNIKQNSLKAGFEVLGPTINFLTNKKSEYYKTNFDEYYILHQDETVSKNVLSQVQKKLLEYDFTRKITSPIPYSGVATNHNDIRDYIETCLTDIAHKYKYLDLVIHISPGTPAMHSIWLLLTTSGWIKEICGNYTTIKLVESVRGNEIDSTGFITKSIELKFEEYKQVFDRINLFSDIKDIAFEDSVLSNINYSEYKSCKMVKLYQEILRLAKFNEPLLLLGERGVGKTRFTKIIRHEYLRYHKLTTNNNMSELSCGQLESTLIESKLFGYIKGSFTGAISPKKGLCLLANNDVLFLDEIQDLPPSAQNMLIKAVEEKCFYPIGSDKPVFSNFRLISASNFTYKELQKKLRQDFIDRITLFILEIPPLREIKEDIPLIWNNVFTEVCNRNNLGGIILDDKWNNDFLKILFTLELPGNIRDLQRMAVNVVKYWDFSQNYCTVEPSIIVRDVYLYHDCTIKNIDNEDNLSWEDNTISHKQIIIESKKKFIQLVESRKRLGEKLSDISDISQRTFNNWKNDVS